MVTSSVTSVPITPSSRNRPRASVRVWSVVPCATTLAPGTGLERVSDTTDRKSTRLNSSHRRNSYAVLCLKKKNALPAHHPPRPLPAPPFLPLLPHPLPRPP